VVNWRGRLRGSQPDFTRNFETTMAKSPCTRAHLSRCLTRVHLLCRLRQRHPCPSDERIRRFERLQSPPLGQGGVAGRTLTCAHAHCSQSTTVVILQGVRVVVEYIPIPDDGFECFAVFMKQYTSEVKQSRTQGLCLVLPHQRRLVLVPVLRHRLSHPYQAHQRSGGIKEVKNAGGVTERNKYTRVSLHEAAPLPSSFAPHFYIWPCKQWSRQRSAPTGQARPGRPRIGPFRVRAARPPPQHSPRRSPAPAPPSPVERRGESKK